MTAQERLIAVAEDQVGYFGKRTNAQLDDFKANAGGKFNKYARDLDALGDFYNGRKNGYDWCDVFVDWCFVQTFGRELAQKLLCQPDKSLGAGTAYSLGYYKKKGRLFTSPQPADQIFFGDAKSTWHTGLVVKVAGGFVHTVEGNAGNPSAVRACKYRVGAGIIKGYGRPDWSLVPDEKEDDNMVYYEKLENVPAWYRPTVEKLVNAGALKGTATGTLDVSEDYCRVMTTLDRLGKLD
ncbi:CHAP domain-containing protein [uncultured Oscillibacter sp.]|uniref:CHAP domain-containing protein n=1 Tax=uncultured Oscillibacter sp. TaxID=876091 RepID=UPI0026070AA2|nr:CHAP domain-containing protein [uncultured Oscillibacter sp.]